MTFEKKSISKVKTIALKIVCVLLILLATIKFDVFFNPQNGLILRILVPACLIVSVCFHRGFNSFGKASAVLIFASISIASLVIYYIQIYSLANLLFEKGRLSFGIVQEIDFKNNYLKVEFLNQNQEVQIIQENLKESYSFSKGDTVQVYYMPNQVEYRLILNQ